MGTKGYDYVLAGQKIKDFECSLCKLLIREATELPCTHLNCQSCLWQWQLDPNAKVGTPNDGSNEFYNCPTCNAPYSIDQLRRSGVTDRVITTSLDIKCIFHGNGCEWKGSIAAFHEHKVLCGFTPASCPFKGCHQTLTRSQVDSHKESCQHKPPICENCGKVYEIQTICPCMKSKTNTTGEVADKVDYALERRLNEIVKCPLLMCDTRVPYRDLMKHVTRECREDRIYELLVKKYDERNSSLIRSHRFHVNKQKTIPNDIADVKARIKDYEENLEMVKNGINEKDSPGSMTKPDNEREAFTKFTSLIKVNDINGLSELLQLYPNVSEMNDGRYRSLLHLVIHDRNRDLKMLYLLLEYRGKKDCFKKEAVDALLRESPIPVLRVLANFDPRLINDTQLIEESLNKFFSQDILKFILNQPNVNMEKINESTQKKVFDIWLSNKHSKKNILMKRKIVKENESIFDKLWF